MFVRAVGEGVRPSDTHWSRGGGDLRYLNRGCSDLGGHGMEGECGTQPKHVVTHLQAGGSDMEGRKGKDIPMAKDGPEKSMKTRP